MRLFPRVGQLGKSVPELGKSFNGLARLILAFWAAGLFLGASGVWCCSLPVILVFPFLKNKCGAGEEENKISSKRKLAI